MSPDLSAWSGAALDLASRVVRFIDGSLSGEPPETFDALALDLHAYQASRCPVRQRLSQGPVHTLHDLPAIPVALFKDLPVGTVAPPGRGPVFLTSGTTAGARGAHRLRSDALYVHGSLSWAQRCLPDWPHRTVNLLLDPAAHPESSLSHMVRAFSSDHRWFLGSNGLDIQGFRRSLADEPAFIGATGFALAELIERDPAPLPPGCTLMVTGGFKGRSTSLDHDALFDEAITRLEPEHLIAEYGMTELSSQLWGVPHQPYRPPPWLRAIAIDPITALPLPAGSSGQLRFVDLCNLDSSVAIETMDQGSVLADGSVILTGRLDGAPARGCSLTVEEALRHHRENLP